MNKFQMSAGKYWVGDLCYTSLGTNDDHWSNLCNQSFRVNGDSKIVIEGYGDIVSIGTMYGDGEYYDQEGVSYSVDAGLIGAVKLDGLENFDYPTNTGRVVDFPYDFEAWSDDDGLIHIGHVIINTGYEDPDQYGDDYYADYDYDDDDYED